MIETRTINDPARPAAPWEGIMSILRRGASGSEVRELQTLLNQRVNPSPRLVVDGQFGAITERAVRRFQTEQWLVSDAVVGPCTWAALRETEAYTILRRVNLVPQPTETTCWAAATAMTLNQPIQAVLQRNASFNTSGGLLNDSDLDHPEATARFARSNGLTIVPGASWTATGFANLMRTYAPLMLHILWNPAGYTTRDPGNPGRYLGSSGHFVVAAGFRGDGTEAGSTLRLHDPWPPMRGHIGSFGYLDWMRDHPAGTYQIMHR
jgi:peptidoglycan hydrolase-like protein with peptidoglycan-binding domain